ncbi:hypothetical protein Kim5_CH00809 [Rhizobium sp. Kim5]|uniref:hypothetical protein n=1 Tax=Rhizobium sp. Kim5 TaxID=2020311 RepID=UPI000A2A0874|nr:hypothetical protein [Rhizobium sp. Kim5]ARQ56916.1 hypothetical protein Kim5_CH00809 [Rhizobium sp. Kim5]
MLRAILNAIKMIVMSPWSALLWGAGALERFFGGGSDAPAAPFPHLEAELPDESSIEEARDLERGRAAAVEHIRKTSPELQVKMFAEATDEDRLQADLSLLTPEQTLWLLDMNDKQLKVVADASDRRIAAALNGEHNALTAILSVGQPEPDDTTGLVHRITAKRAATFATAPAQSVGCALH